GSCPADTSPPVSITITTSPDPILTYPDDSWCVFDDPVNPQPLTGSGSILGGTYTAVPAGLAINVSTGQITPSASDTGTYTVIYTTLQGGGCPPGADSLTITIHESPVADLSYP